MALPKLSPAQRAEALQKAAAVRKERGDLMAALKAGTLPLTDLLAREDNVVGKVRVRRVLESLPGIGTATSYCPS
ncbi:integration host factor, actinobacterial type [Streptomyces sp. 4.24]|uniref:integration host factor, actinobacterial type n=1 Tax=Streptomyces tritrimontium TaxID=3406573 RepID=UPI003BB62430